MFQTSETFSWMTKLSLRFNRLLTMDDYFGLGSFYDHPNGYLDVGQVDKDFSLRPMTDATSGGRMYFQTLAVLSSNEQVHQRRMYNILDVLKDIGGLSIFIIGFFGMMIRPWAAFHYMIKAMQKLYRARTKKDPEFRKSRSAKHFKKQKKVEEILTGS